MRTRRVLVAALLATAVSGARGAPLPARAITCTIDATFHLGTATYRMTSFVTGVLEGQG
jgi:hypothetical protein